MAKMDAARQFGHGGWAGSGNSARFTDQRVPPSTYFFVIKGSIIPLKINLRLWKSFNLPYFFLGYETTTSTPDCGSEHLRKQKFKRECSQTISICLIVWYLYVKIGFLKMATFLGAAKDIASCCSQLRRPIAVEPLYTPPTREAIAREIFFRKLSESVEIESGQFRTI